MAGSIFPNEPKEPPVDKAALEQYFNDKDAQQSGKKIQVNRLVVELKKGKNGVTKETLVYRQLKLGEKVDARLWGKGSASLTKVIPYLSSHPELFLGPD